MRKARCCRSKSDTDFYATKFNVIGNLIERKNSLMRESKSTFFRVSFFPRQCSSFLMNLLWKFHPRTFIVVHDHECTDDPPPFFFKPRKKIVNLVFFFFFFCAKRENDENTIKDDENCNEDSINYWPNCDTSIWMRSCENEVILPIEGKISGVIPKWLRGTLLRNGPGSLKVGEYKFDHLFDSSALLHR